MTSAEDRGPLSPEEHAAQWSDFVAALWDRRRLLEMLTDLPDATALGLLGKTKTKPRKGLTGSKARAFIKVQVDSLLKYRDNPNVVQDITTAWRQHRAPEFFKPGADGLIARLEWAGSVDVTGDQGDWRAWAMVGLESRARPFPVPAGFVQLLTGAVGSGEHTTLGTSVVSAWATWYAASILRNARATYTDLVAKSAVSWIQEVTEKLGPLKHVTDTDLETLDDAWKDCCAIPAFIERSQSDLIGICKTVTGTYLQAARMAGVPEPAAWTEFAVSDEGAAALLPIGRLLRSCSKIESAAVAAQHRLHSAFERQDTAAICSLLAQIEPPPPEGVVDVLKRELDRLDGCSLDEAVAPVSWALATHLGLNTNTDRSADPLDTLAREVSFAFARDVSDGRYKLRPDEAPARPSVANGADESPQPVAPVSTVTDTAAPSPRLAVESTAPVEVAATPPRPVTTPTATDPTPPKATPHPECMPPDVLDNVWFLLERDRLPLAYQYVRAMENLDRPTLPLSSSLLLAVLLARTLKTSFGNRVDRLRDAFSTLHGLMSEIDPEHASATGLIALSAVMRPALLAPASQAVALLPSLPIPASPRSLHKLREAISQLVRSGVNLNPTTLKGIKELDRWKHELTQMQEQTRLWLNSQRQSSILYAVATDVWHRLLDEKGEIGSLLVAIINNNEGRRKDAAAALEKFADSREIDESIRKTHIELKKRGARARPIEARARNTLRLRIDESLGLISAWIQLLESRPDRKSQALHPRANKARVETFRALETARTDVAETRASGQPPPAIGAGFAVTQQALDNLWRLLDPDSPVETISTTAAALIGEPLLAVRGISLDTTWEPTDDVDPVDLYDELTRIVADERSSLESDEPHDLEHSFRDQCDAGNHHVTGLIIELLESRGDDRADALRTDRERAVRTCRRDLAERLVRIERLIDGAVASDLLDESTLQELRSRVEQTRPEETQDFGRAEAGLEAVEAEIDERRNESSREARQQLEASGLENTAPKSYSRIADAIDAGDLVTAYEYLQHVEDKKPLPEPGAETNAFDAFFPQFIQEMTSFTGSKRVPDLVDSIEKGRSIGPLNMSRTRGAQSKSAAAMMRAWLRLKNRRGLSQECLKEVLRGLGFDVSSIKPSVQGSRGRVEAFDVVTSPIRDRHICAIPQYGSVANGRYRVACVWDRPSEEELIEIAGRQGREESLIFLYLARMTETQRRDLALLCRERHRSFMLIDELLMLYVCQSRGQRLRPLFECSFPFTVADPFTTTAGLVPPEMFFGRERERKAIFEAGNTCLVYGGRQLGKTALLRHVERHYHRPDDGVVVLYLDLKAEGIGLNLPIESIWAVIGRELARARVSKQAGRRAETIQRHVVAWLDAEPGRRIVLLLDEADEFLATDGQSDDEGRVAFSIVGRIKGLMDTTKWRFKTVFSGLHNVQRTAKDINTPLAHLGDPICVGPLLERGGTDARALVREPLQALGYRFESEDLVTRILAHTNYYPSLIQIFCKQLLKHLGDRPSDTKDRPPYPITSRELDEAYQDRELHRSIADRFHWTLNLDARYRVIALLIAYYSLEERAEGALSRGFDIDWVRRRVMDEWSQGFAEDQSREAYRTILDEMQGLGILRRIGHTRYALRNPNVLTLLGNKDEVFGLLCDAIAQKPPVGYERANFRRALREDPCLRSPLTAGQESELLDRGHPVTVVFGSRLSHIHRLPEFFKSDAVNGFAGASDRIEMSVVDEVDLDPVAFVEGLSRGSSEEAAIARVFLVPPQTAWSVEHVLHAAESLAAGKQTTRQAGTRVIFLAEPKDTMTWCTRARSLAIRAKASGVARSTLGRWSRTAVVRWLQDTGFGPPDAHVGTDQFMAVAGTWSALLYAVGKHCESQPEDWAEHLHTLAGEIDNGAGWWDEAGFHPDTIAPLRVMADYGDPIRADDLRGLGDSLDARTVDLTLEWANLLGFVNPGREERWQLDPVIARLIQARR